MRIVPPTAIKDPKLKWFRDAKFGMFVHFGLYALLGRGEWIQYQEEIPMKEYERLMRRFNPKRFDPDEWVDVAEKAGCRYINLTAKHHDGFCLFGSYLTDYNITRTPFKRDLVAELAAACHRRGMRLCLYYSQPDWHHPNFVHMPGAFKDLQNPPPEQKPDWPEYLRYYHGQVRELCTRYGQIDGIWFDGSQKDEEAWQGRKIYKLIKKHQPGAVVNDRARYGDFFTPERSLPDDLTGYMFEACQSVSATSWGYHPDSAHYSLSSLLDNFVRVIAKGGNFLLNVGPMPDGRIPEAQVSRMAMIGKWLSIHGEAVFGTEAGRLDTGSQDMAAARKGDTIYLFLCRWPVSDRLLIPGIREQPSSARLLAGLSRVEANATKEGLELSGLPMFGPDPALNVIRIEFARTPKIVISKPKPPRARIVSLATRGETVLSVADAGVSGFSTKGERLRIVVRPGMKPESIIHNWGSTDQKLTWAVKTSKTGAFSARILLSCPRLYAGSRFALKGAVDIVEGVVKGTADDHEWQPLGGIRLPAGVSRLSLQPIKMPYGYVFANIAGISLRLM